MLHLLLLSPHSLLAPVSIPNFRDVGGMATASGRVIRSGVLHRSASPANATAADAEAVLQTMGVRTVLDLRGERDAMRESGPRLLQKQTKFLPLLTESMMRTALIGRARSMGPASFAKLIVLSVGKKVSPSRRLRKYLGGEVDLRLARILDQVSLADLYWLIVSERSDELRGAVEMCATGEALPVLVHCTHGKDRTGVLVALLLYACGVREEDIIKDYSLSHDWGCSVDGKWAMRQALPERVRSHVSQDVLDHWCEAPEAVLRELFDKMRSEYGSVEAYFDSIGVDAEMRAQLAQELTQQEA